jgi:hypothetical protein
MANPSKSRSKLTESNAIDIFKLKSTSISAVLLGNAYDVSEKAIRDIWKGRTWAKETCHQDMARPYHGKQVGRPIGSKDTKPRIRRATHSTGSSALLRVSSLLSSRSSHASCSAVPPLHLLPDSTAHSLSVDPETLDDLLFDWEQKPQKRIGDEPFSQDWALALQSLARSRPA